MLGDRVTLIFIWGVAVAAVVLLGLYIVSSPTAQVGLGIALGGATGNLLDVLRRGAVVDFIDIGVWPVFNLADIAIVVGAVKVIWVLTTA